MSLFGARKQVLQDDRRRNARFTVDCPATVQTVGGQHSGRITNISEDGARLEMETVPAKGIACLLNFADVEAFCRIVWTSTHCCGVEFDRPLRHSAIAGLFQVDCSNNAPIARTDNIRAGRRRSGLVPRED